MTRRLLLGIVTMGLLLGGLPASASAGAPTPALACDEVQLALTAAGDPVATGTCPGVRPGAYLETRHADGSGSGCSFNFVFEGRDAEGNALGRYIGTAGHCVVDPADGETTWTNAAAPQAFDAAGNHVGDYVYAMNTDGRDFALIKLRPGVESNPAMCHWGGPTGVFDDLATSMVELKHYGQGVALGDTVPARTAWADRMTNPDQARAYGAVLFGDSGSGIITAAGEAVGVVVTVGFGTSADGSGTVGITRLTPQLERAERALGIDLELVTAPRT